MIVHNLQLFLHNQCAHIVQAAKLVCFIIDKFVQEIRTIEECFTEKTHEFLSNKLVPNYIIVTFERVVFPRYSFVNCFQYVN